MISRKRKAKDRAALLIRCSREEAAAIRNQAAAEHRSVSGCMLYVLERSASLEERFAPAPRLYAAAQRAASRAAQQPHERAALLLRCTSQQAQRIRAVAARRGMSISQFVLFSFHRHWRALQDLAPLPRTGLE
jgi:uncharacterized protein (DUF1778 family)